MPKSKKIIVAGLLGCALVLTLIFAALGMAWWWPLITLILLAGGVVMTRRNQVPGAPAHTQAAQSTAKSPAQSTAKSPAQSPTTDLTMSTPEDARALVERYTKHPARLRDRQLKRKDPGYNPATALVIEHIVSLVLQPLAGKSQHLEQCFKALSAEILRQAMIEAEQEQRKFYERRAQERASASGTTLPATQSTALEPSAALSDEVKQYLMQQGVHPLLITAAMAYAHRRLAQGQVKPWEELKWFELRPQAIGSVLTYIDELVTKPDHYDLSPELCAQYQKLAAKLKAMS